MCVSTFKAKTKLHKEIFSSGLTVRQHPTSGYCYPQDLRVIPVGNYKDVEHLLSEGIQNRTIASTNMNHTSSRAHTIVTIHLDQIIQTNYGEIKRMSTMHFIDLAGRNNFTMETIFTFSVFNFFPKVQKHFPIPEYPVID